LAGSMVDWLEKDLGNGSSIVLEINPATKYDGPWNYVVCLCTGNSMLDEDIIIRTRNPKKVIKMLTKVYIVLRESMMIGE